MKIYNSLWHLRSLTCIFYMCTCKNIYIYYQKIFIIINYIYKYLLLLIIFIFIYNNVLSTIYSYAIKN